MSIFTRRRTNVEQSIGRKSTRRSEIVRRRMRLEQLERRRVLTTYFVDTIDDVVANDGFVSLREAIEAANSNTAVNEAAAGQIGGTSIDRIEFASDLGDAVIALGGSELVISDSVFISRGEAASVTLDGGGLSRVLSVIDDADTVLLSGLTITGGVDAVGGGISVVGAQAVQLDDVRLIENLATGDAATQGGGAIFNDGGSLVVTGGEIRGNVASGASGSGGGILTLSGSVSIEGTAIASNTANRAGGGIELGVGSLTLSNVLLGGRSPADGNVAGPVGSAAPGNGGGIHVTGGEAATSVAIFGGSVLSNVAASEGGGLWNQRGAVMTVSAGTLVAGNRAGGETNQEGGGGLFNNGGILDIDDARIENNATTGDAGGGGGVTNDGGIVSIARTIIGGNFAVGPNGSGGGVLNLNGGLFTLADSELTNNVASRAGGGIEDASNVPGVTTVTLRNVLLSDNNAGVEDEDATAAAPGNGGGLHVTGASDVRIVDSVVTENIAAREGGGLWNGSGTLTIENTIVERNVASGDAADDGGGGVFNNGGVVVISGGTISRNIADGVAGSGGGILNLGGTVDVTDTMIALNLSNRAGGGIESTAGSITELEGVTLDSNVTGPTATASPGNGGGLHVTGAGDVTIIGGVVSNNVAAREGGGLWNGAGLMAISGTEIIANVASGDAADDGGGGIFNNGGDMIIDGAVISGNVADGTSGSGGGLFSLGGNIEISSSGIEFNGANRAGGGVEVVDGMVTLTDVGLVNNDVDGTVTGGMAAPGNGGGLHVTGMADVTVDGGVVFGNFAASEGGGLWNQAGSTLTIQNGSVILANVALGDAADNGGGGVFNNGGILVVSDAEIIGNSADGASGSGGGILNVAGGLVTITDTLISENVASRAGGGIEEASATTGPDSDVSLTLNNVVMEANNAGVLHDGLGGGAFFSSPGNGGGLHVSGAGNVSITGGVVGDNVAGREGGGLWNGAGTMTIDGTEIFGNFSSGDAADDGGGGIFNNGGTLIVANANISDNAAVGSSGSGGGIFNLDGIAMVTDTRITGNVANRAGGGIEGTAASTTDLVGVNLDGNVAGPAGSSAPGNGGGLHITGAGNASVSGGTVNNNVAAAEGGGLWNGTGTMIVGDGVQVSGNAAAGMGADQGGGGIFNAGGTLIVNAAEITENSAAGASLFELSGSQENPPLMTLASGSSILRYDSEAGTLSLDLFVSGIELVDDTDLPQLTGAHIHVGAVGSNGPVVLNLGVTEWVTEMSGIRLRVEDLSFPDASEDALLAGDAYVNVHSTANPSGEVRGQITFPSTMGSGGGIFNDMGTLTATGTTISGNVASRAGGGIETNVGVVTLDEITLSQNVAGPSGQATPGNGGGLHVSGAGSVSITDATVDSNFAATEGGGLWNSGVGVLSVETSTLSANVSPLGGGLHQDGSGGTTDVINSTISGNSAAFGGGINTDGGLLSIIRSTIALNDANTGGGLNVVGGSVTVGSSIVGANTAPVGPNIAGTVSSQNHNVIGNVGGASVTSLGTSDRLGIAPGIEPLADNGGPTMTHALLPFSLALGNGAPGGVDEVSVDQRGVARPQGGGPDTGSFESDLSSPVAAFQNQVIATDVNDDGDVSAFDALLVINFMNRNGGEVNLNEETAPEGESSSQAAERANYLLDVSGDGMVTALDALRVINQLNRETTSSGSADRVFAAVSPATTGTAVPMAKSGEGNADVDEDLLEQLAVDAVMIG